MKCKYNPKFDIGTKIYTINYHRKTIVELEIEKIEITKTNKGIKYLYYTRAYPPFEGIEKEDGYYFLSKEKAEKALAEYIKKEKELKKQAIIMEYERIKKEYEEIMKEESK